MRKSKILIALIMIVALCALTLLAFVGCADVGKLSVVSAQFETTDEGQLWQFKIHWEYGEEVPKSSWDFTEPRISFLNTKTNKYKNLMPNGFEIKYPEDKEIFLIYETIERDKYGFTFAFELILEPKTVLEMKIQYLPNSQVEEYDKQMHNGKDPSHLYETVKLKITMIEIEEVIR